ncbi:MAG: hypothetical protein WCH93_10650 [Actinomycetota bacterium]
MGIRRALSVLFAFVGALVAVVGLVVVVADKEVFDRPTVERTVDKIVADPDVTRLLGREIVKRAVLLGDLEEQRKLVQTYVDERLAQPAVQKEIRSGVFDAYTELMDTDHPRIDFNLPNQAKQVRRQLVGLNPNLDATLPISENLLRFTLFERSALPWSYDLVRSTRSAAWGLFVAGAALVAIALLLGPGRLGIFSLAAFFASLGMLVVWLIFTTGANRVLDGIDDGLSRRVARLAADQFLRRITQISLAVTIFGAVAVVGGLVTMWVRAALFPPKPKITRVKGVPPV